MASRRALFLPSENGGSHLAGKKLNDTHGLAVVLWYAAILCHLEHKPAEVEAHAADLVELSTRQSFALWLAGGEIFRGWARSTCWVTRQRASHGSRKDWPTGAQSDRFGPCPIS